MNNLYNKILKTKLPISNTHYITPRDIDMFCSLANVEKFLSSISCNCKNKCNNICKKNWR
ncbi:MAG: hypothetical protein RSC92_04960 [Clostridia bacterium]